jgi:hypothetical protein
MKTVARYTWSKKDSEYGWTPWQPPQLTIEREGQNWSVYEEDGSRLCMCVDYRSAQRVVALLRKLAVQPLTMYALPQAGVLGQTPQGKWTFHEIEHSEDYGETFPTREAAEAYIFARPRTVH